MLYKVSIFPIFIYMDVIINDNLFNVKCVFTQKDIQNGMKGKTFNNFDGMLFVMDKDNHSFWMKDCIIPLDIIFINDDKITEIHHNCPPCRSDDCESYSGFGDLVLELPANSCSSLKIKVGNPVFIENSI